MMACVVFTCENCGHFGHTDFGSLHDPSCPKCDSRSVSVEYDEDHREDFDEPNECFEEDLDDDF